LVLKNSIGIGTLHCDDLIIHRPGSLLKRMLMIFTAGGNWSDDNLIFFTIRRKQV